jgi:hypothetical protein
MKNNTASNATVNRMAGAPSIPFGHFFDVHFDPEGTPGSGGTIGNGQPAPVPSNDIGAPGGTTGNGSPASAPQGSADPAQSPTIDPNLQGAWRAEERRKYTERIAKSLPGFELLTDPKTNKTDLVASLLAWGDKHATAKLAGMQQSQSVTEEQYKQQLDALRNETMTYKQQLEQEKQSNIRFQLATRVHSGFAGKVFDGAAEAATEHFLRDYQIVTDEDGRESIRGRDGFVLNDRKELATLAEAQAKFLNDNLYYQPATARPGPTANGSAAGVRVITPDQLSAIPPDELAKGLVNGTIRVAE